MPRPQPSPRPARSLAGALIRVALLGAALLLPDPTAPSAQEPEQPAAQDVAAGPVAPETATRDTASRDTDVAAPEAEPAVPRISEPQPVEGAAHLGWSTVRDPAFQRPVYQTRLTAAWDPDERLITGTEELTWRNTSSVPITELRFHHYLNAFSSNRTTFMQESGGQLRGDRFDDRRWGWIETSSVKLADGTDLKPVERYISPDDHNPWDRTVAVYPLAEPLLPGQQIKLDIEFESKMPAIFARTGAEGDYILAGQWFPKIGVFEDRGDRGRAEPGWNCHQFHANSEFFADFGDYDVTLTLPERYRGKVGATGVQVGQPKVADGEVTVRFVQPGVHDFAWTGDPDFRVVVEPFDPQRDVPPGMARRIAGLLGLSEQEIALRPVEITLLVQPDHADQIGRYLGAAKAGLRGYGLRLGAYPYSTLTMVDPPRGAGGSGGMEYPTFITLGTHALLSIPPFNQIRLPEVVTVHEFGHQYFQGMSASNEFEESWLDEGINSYYEMVVMDEEYPATLHLLDLDVGSFELDRARLGSGRYTDPIDLPAWRFLNTASYGLNSYPRTAVTLRHLENLLGTGTFDRAMRAFFQSFKFHHPSTADFERSIERSSGRDLRWFFDQALHSTRTLDYAVRSVESRKVKTNKGIFWEHGERTEVGVKPEKKGLAGWLERFRGARAEGDASGDDDSADVDGAGEGGTRWHSIVTVIRRGELIQPVTVEMRFADGSALRRSWEGRTRWIRWTLTTDSKLVSAQVDPDGLLALDINRLNNSRRIEPDRWPRRKLLTEMLFWFQTAFAGGGLFA